MYYLLGYNLNLYYVIGLLKYEISPFLSLSSFLNFIQTLNTPIFIYFGILFLSTTVISLFLLSYFGFYGVFLINLITLLLF